MKKTPLNPQKNSASTKLSALEFSVFRRRPLMVDGALLGPGHSVLLGVSGGADSVALFHILHRLSVRWGFELKAAYVHHGASKDPRQARYRDRAEKLVSKIAKALDVPLIILKPGAALGKTKLSKNLQGKDHQPEEALREMRRAALVDASKAGGVTLLAMAHHSNDLFETRLIRLLRGTGPEGLISMREMTPARGDLAVPIWRPLLEQSRADIEAYLQQKKMKAQKDWLEDPSNRNLIYLRNRIRRKLIPMIDKMRSGGAAAMSRSLDLMARDSTPQSFGSPLDAHLFLNRSELMKLQAEERRRVLSHWLLAQQIRNFSKSQIEEVLKRIDTPQKRLSFTVGRRVWLVDQHVRLKSTGP